MRHANYASGQLRVAVMYVGRLVELAPTDAVFARHRHPYTAALMRAVPVPNPRVVPSDAILTVEVSSPAEPRSGCYFHPRCRRMLRILFAAPVQPVGRGGGRGALPSGSRQTRHFPRCHERELPRSRADADGLRNSPQPCHGKTCAAKWQRTEWSGLPSRHCSGSRWQRSSATPLPRLRIERLDQPVERRPRHNAPHLGKKRCPPHRRTRDRAIESPYLRQRVHSRPSSILWGLAGKSFRRARSGQAERPLDPRLDLTHHQLHRAHCRLVWGGTDLERKAHVDRVGRTDLAD